MRGIVRPCRQHLGPELYARWQAHLCGLCLTLRDLAGQPERVLTGYDVLLLSVLVEAQDGQVETTAASPCPLRGFTRATVVASSSPAARLAAAGALLTGGAGLTDKVGDGDLPAPTRGAARRMGNRFTRRGVALAESVGLDPAPVLLAPGEAARVERVHAADLGALLAPSGEAVAALFAHAAAVAGRPHNAEPLREAGDAFGRLVHLLDAVEDREADEAAGRFNPLTATGAGDAAARELAEDLVRAVQSGVRRADLTDRALVDVLLGRELQHAVHRVLPPLVAVPSQRRSAVGAVAALTLMLHAVFIGGSGGCCGPTVRGGYGYPQGRRRRGYPPPTYGYRRVGPSCGEMLACNCCANLACNACCCDGGGDGW